MRWAMRWILWFVICAILVFAIQQDASHYYPLEPFNLLWLALF